MQSSINSQAFPLRCFSHSGKFLLLGMDNGVLRIHPLDGSNDFEHFSSFWALNVHDNHHGGIQHIKTSFDDKYVFTAGLDGNFFVFRFMDEAVKGLKVPHKVSIPSAKVIIRFNHLFLLCLIDNPGLVHSPPEKFEKRSFISTIRPTELFFFFVSEKFENADFAISEGRKAGSIENGTSRKRPSNRRNLRLQFSSA